MTLSNQIVVPTFRKALIALFLLLSNILLSLSAQSGLSRMPKAFSGLQQINAISPLTGSASYEISAFQSIPSGIRGMAVDENDVLYFADSYSRLNDDSRIYTLNPPYTGEPMMTEISGQSIAGLMWFEKKLYVAFLNKDEIEIYDENLEFLESKVVKSPWNFTTDGKNVYVLTYYGNIGVISGNRVKTFVKGLSNTFDIQYSGASSLYVSDHSDKDGKGRIAEYGYDGLLISTLKVDVSDPAGLEMDLDNKLYIADPGNNKVLMVTPESGISVLTDEYLKPFCITRSNSGHILVSSDQDGGTLLVIKAVR